MSIHNKNFEKFYQKELLPVFKLKGKFKAVKTPNVVKSKTGFHIGIAHIKILEPLEEGLKIMFEKIQAIPITFYFNQTESSIKPNIIYQEHSLGEFITAIHWVYKKRWNPKHKIPCNKQFAKIIEPQGDFYLSILELCNAVYEIHRFIGHECIEYVLWFEKIMVETKMIEASKHIPYLENLKSKKEEYEDKYKLLEQIKDFKNPLDKNSNYYFWELLNKSFYLIQTRNYENLEKNQWKNFINAYGKLLKAEKKRTYTTCTDGHSLYKVKHRGNSTEKHKVTL